MNFPIVILITVTFLLGLDKATSQAPDVCKTPTGEQLLQWSKSHQTATLVTSFGTPINDPTNALTAGPRGPMLLQDTYFLDEMQSFDRERIPERVVHAKGAGAFGVFEVTHDISRYSMAKVFSGIGSQTPVVVRFSQVAGEMGTADSVRDTRGFAVKFYTSDGIWDLVGNNSPVFFVRDPLLFPDLIHSQKRNPATHLRDPSQYWDFASLRPETLFQIMIVNSDNGIPDGYRHMDGFGIHTFLLVNATGNFVFCKFHLSTNQGIKNLSSSQGTILAGEDPDSFIRDLYNAIGNGNFPSWNLSVQIMTKKEAATFQWNPFDATKVWPKNEYPPIPVGRLTLNQNPSNYFVNVEQLAFNPAHLVPGIEASPDKLLQGRLFAYSDTQSYRLGPNGILLQANQPRQPPENNYERDGFDRFSNNQKGAPNYYPNSFNGAKPSRRGRIVDYLVEGNIGRYDTSEEDNFSQPRMFWESLSQGERNRLVNNIVSTLNQAYPYIQKRTIKVFSEVSPELGHMISQALDGSEQCK